MGPLKRTDYLSLKLSNFMVGLAMVPVIISFIGWLANMPLLLNYIADAPIMTIETIIGISLLSMAILGLNYATHLNGDTAKVVTNNVNKALIVLFVLLGLTYVFYAAYRLEMLLEGKPIPPIVSSLRTTTSLFILGLTIYVAYFHRRWQNLALFLILIPYLITIISLTGYIVGQASFYQEYEGIGMSIPTSVSVLFLVFAAASGPLRHMGNSFLMDTGMAGFLSRSLIPLAMLFPPVCAWIVGGIEVRSIISSSIAIALLAVLPCLMMTVAIAYMAYWMKFYEENVIAEQVHVNTLAESNRAKNEFLAILSHELRTPMHIAQGFLSLLKSERPGSENYEEYLNKVQESIFKEIKIIDAILDISEITKNNFKIKKGNVSVQKLFEELNEKYQKAIKDKNIDLIISIDPAIENVSADSARLKKAFENIFSNSIKFTPEFGHINIYANSSGQYVKVIFKDSGEGIDSHLIPQVFESFWQVDSSVSRPHQGLGLGLSISKAIFEAHGGWIEVESDGKDKGSQFTIYLPRDTSSQD